MRRILAVVLSLAVLAGAGAGLAAWMVASRRAGLVVDARPAPPSLQGPVTLSVRRRGPGQVTLAVDGAVQAAPGGRLTVDPARLGPGLHTVTAGQRYLGRHPRQVAFTWLAGPFGRPGGTVPCAVRVSLAQGTVDTLAATLGALVKTRLASAKGLPPARQVTVGLHLVTGGLDASISARFAGGATLTARLPLAVSTAGPGLLQVSRRGPVKAVATGSLGVLASLKGGGVLAALGHLFAAPQEGLEGALRAARAAGRRETGKLVAAAAQTWLPEVNRRLAAALPKRLSVGLLGARLTVALTRCGDPRVVPGRALVLRYGARPSVTARGVTALAHPATPGPVRRGIQVPAAGPLPRLRGVRLTLSEDLVSAILDAAWRSGALTAWAGDADRLAHLNRRLAAGLDLKVARLALALPPVARLSPAGISVALGELRVDLAGPRPRRLAATLEGKVTVTVDDGTLEVGLAPTAVRASCGWPIAGGIGRQPCYPALLEGLDDRLAHLGPLTLTASNRAGRGPARLTVRRLVTGAGTLTLEGTLRLVPGG